MTEITSIQNFRDLGGLQTVDGRRLKRGLLFRGGSLVSVSDEDSALLTGHYGLSRIFDFRSSFEIQMAPDREIEGVSNLNLEVIDMAGDVWKQIIFMDSSEEDPMQRLITLSRERKIQETAAGIYVFLAGSEASRKQYGTFLRYLADDTPGAVLWHCSYGKDRTGVGAAVLLAALGCDRDTIIGDYAKSSENYAPRVRKVLEMIPENDPERTAMAEVVKTFIGANVNYFNAGIDSILNKYGSAGKYLTEGLGLNNTEISKLRDKFLE